MNGRAASDDWRRPTVDIFSATALLIIIAVIIQLGRWLARRGRRVAVVAMAQHDGVCERGAQCAKHEQRAPPHREPHRGKRQHGAHGNDGAVEQQHA